MKKMNKKGFTLAELLIVIAIIAVLIAIAIPTFSGALDNARLQTDHANIRSAYAMVMTGNMMGGIQLSGSDELTAGTDGKIYVFQKDGTLKAKDNSDNPYELQATRAANHADCKASVGCQTGSYVESGSQHTDGFNILITYSTTDGFKLKLGTPS